ncbi:Clp protease N-terminal domain-containing protein [Streptomyces sp. NPDC002004]
MFRPFGTDGVGAVQPRIPPRAVDSGPPTRAEPDVRLTAELASALAGARRRAVRDGDRLIDTAHLLHSLLESDPAVRASLADGSQIARVLGYLVQRSIGYGLRWQVTVEDSGSVPVACEAGLSPAAATAMAAACERAARRGELLAEGVDLFAAMVADPECRAVEVLRRAGVDETELLRRLDERPAEMCEGPGRGR